MSSGSNRNATSGGWWKYSWIAFALTGAASRLYFSTVESRVQIVAFWLGAVALHLVLRLAGNERVGWISWALNGAAATAAIIAVKIAIEGVYDFD